jgi:hypothetical protein
VSKILFVVISVIFFLGLFGILIQEQTGFPPGEGSGDSRSPAFEDDFRSGFLNPALWQVTGKGDVADRYVGVHDAGHSNETDYRLYLGMNTIGTADNTVKFLGVRSLIPVHFSDRTEVSFDLDWNNQSNGCYLTASVMLCPTVTDSNPEDENNWLKIEYTGVPPGRHARCSIIVKTNGTVRNVYTEGWPEQRTGRPVGYQQIRIIVDSTTVRFLENGREISSIPSKDLNFTGGYLYLQMSSHSNYPFRDIYFDNILVR